VGGVPPERGRQLTETQTSRSVGKGFPTETKKFEFYSETLKKVLTEHAEKHKVSIDEVLKVTNYEAAGEKAFVPHYESPLRHGDKARYPFDLIDMKSRFNREGRSANLPLVLHL
jgi:hypothetical protein